MLPPRARSGTRPSAGLVLTVVSVLALAGCAAGASPSAGAAPSASDASSGAASPSGSAGATKLAVGLGYIPSVQFAQFYLADQAGYYRDVGLEVTLQNKIDPDLVTLLVRAARITLAGFGVVTALGTLGVDVKALVAGLGLTGFALGFALRDIISNTLAGVLILLFRPFHRGDHVSVAGAEGVVADVDLRYTTLVVDESTRVLVPNSTLFTNAIRVERRA